MRYLDVCAGISASTVAWKPLGWEAAAYSEIEAAPRAVLAHHYPDTPLHGDFTTIRGDEYGPIDLLVGGTPCQDFSVAGLRAGLGGDRGNLSLQFLLLLARTRARWVVWENVPGVFSSLSHDAPDLRPPEIDLDAGDGPSDGEEVVVEDRYDADESHALGCFLAGLQELGYGVAYRVLDAQFAGVPQRRRRIFVVGYLGDWRRAAAVLLERHSLSGHPAPRREAREGAAGRVARSLAIRGRDGAPHAELGDELANAILTPSGGRAGIGVGAALIESVSATVSSKWAKGSGGPSGDECQNLLAVPSYAIQAGALRENPENGPDGVGVQEGCAYTLEARAEVQAVAFPINANALRGDGTALTPSMDAAGKVRLRDPGLGVGDNGDPADTLQAAGPGAVGTPSAVRRLTPRECERLQGFPDDYTLVPNRGKPMADGPRYKALGNSMAVPVMRWIGERITAVDALQIDDRKAA